MDSGACTLKLPSIILCLLIILSCSKKRGGMDWHFPSVPPFSAFLFTLFFTYFGTWCHFPQGWFSPSPSNAITKGACLTKQPSPVFKCSSPDLISTIGQDVFCCSSHKQAGLSSPANSKTIPSRNVLTNFLSLAGKSYSSLKLFP